MTRFVRFAIAALVLVIAVARPVMAQATTGSINGSAADTGGGVLPGVTVTATSPVLMGAQTAVTNELGQYRFPSLPPGTYALKYELSAFATVTREGIQVSIGFTATVNVQLPIATVQESVIVSGASPLVDVQNSNVQTNFNKDLMASIPNSRDLWALLSVAPGTRMTNYDVGGSRAGSQTGFSSFGQTGQIRISLDGINTTEGLNGGANLNYGALEEVQIGSDSNDASMPNPGVQLTGVMKSGGNTVKGDLHFDFQNKQLQSGNVTDDLQRKGISGLGSGTTIYTDPNLSIGGPIRKDKFWYFASFRSLRVGATIAGFPVESPGNFELLTRNDTLSDKLTYQIDRNNKISHTLEIRHKIQAQRGASSTLYSDAVVRQDSAPSYGNVQWDRVVGPTFFFTARVASWGYSWPNYPYGTTGQLGVNLTPRRTEQLTGNTAGSGRSDHTTPRRKQFDWAGTLYREEWLGGSHAIKMGWLSEWETDKYQDNGFLGSYTLMFNSVAGEADFTRPFRVTLENAPRNTADVINHHGAYVHDQIVLGANRRITINAGIRWDRYSTSYRDQAINQGPFRDFFYTGAPLPNGFSLPASFPSLEIAGKDVLTFPAGFGPRLGIAWNVRGDGKTALKANWGRYVFNPDTQGTINPLQRLTAVFNWTDRNTDRQFTIDELGTFVSSAGAVRNSINADLKQQLTDDMSFFVEHELRTNLGIRLGYVQRDNRNISQSAEIGRPYSLFTAQRSVADPGADGIAGTGDDGPAFTVYDVPATVTTIPASLTQLTTRSDMRSGTKNIDLTISKRMANRWSFLSTFFYNWTSTVGHPQTPNEDRFNDVEITNWAWKAVGRYNAPWGISVNPVVRYQSGLPLNRVVQVTLRTGTLNYQAEAPDAYRAPNVTIADLSVDKRFAWSGSHSVSLFLAAFNFLNANTATAEDNIVGVRTTPFNGQVVSYQRFLRPTDILPPRVVRVGVNLTF